MKRPWSDLDQRDLHTLLIALVGFEHGPEPEKHIAEIRETRRRFMEIGAGACKVDKDTVAMDFGSGCGFGTGRLAELAAEVHACDISEAFLEFARSECRSYDNIHFHRVERFSLASIDDESIDAICAASVFIHFNPYDIFLHLEELSRVLRPGGRIWFDVADPGRLDFRDPGELERTFVDQATSYRKAPETLPGLVQWVSPATVIKIAQALGFKTVRQWRRRRGIVLEKGGEPRVRSGG